MARTDSTLLQQLAEHARSLLRGPDRVILGITGAPGAGKTTLADALTQTLRAESVDTAADFVARVPMDGFHLADKELRRLGRLQRKGAPDTFDVNGYAALLARLKEDRGEAVYAPAFDRDVGQPVAGSICIPPETRLIITEGNYLLTGGEWMKIAPLLTEVWFIDVEDELRVKRLVARHVIGGKSAVEAQLWAESVDQKNAAIIAATRSLADLLIDLNADSVSSKKVCTIPSNSAPHDPERLRQ